MILFYAGLDEHKIKNGIPSAWVASFGAVRDGRFMYDRVIFVRQCNIRPMSDGKLVKNLPIYHAAVVFMMSDKLSHVLPIKDDSMLVNLLKKHEPATLPCRDDRIVLLRDYWPSIEKKQIYALESPEQSKLPYQNFHCMSLPGWNRGDEDLRTAMIELLKFDQKEVFETTGMTVMKNVAYVLDTPELKLVLRHNYASTYYEQKSIRLVEKDIFLR